MSRLSVNTVKSVKSTLNKLDSHSAYVQIAVGGGTGFIVGYVFFKVSKVLAICIGSAILTVEVAVETGLIKIDWTKVTDQQHEPPIVRQMAVSPFTPMDYAIDVDKAKQIILSSARLSIAILGGFLLGFGFS
ncbi:PREDICTED: FUN14 domain-containing protein 2-like [Drosophila arizonae]|uniref:FUN14 domain-containing protein 2-like n=1 Tax=Drosophila arizonae TaxID=7263 RepID=A0ABM1PZU8_DROAR|nr:PREDICTED: FUN14 domain-containing protein 2-like [Drosophila arizonae]